MILKVKLGMPQKVEEKISILDKIKNALSR